MCKVLITGKQIMAMIFMEIMFINLNQEKLHTSKKHASEESCQKALLKQRNYVLVVSLEKFGEILQSRKCLCIQRISVDSCLKEVGHSSSLPVCALCLWLLPEQCGKGTNKSNFTMEKPDEYCLKPVVEGQSTKHLTGILQNCQGHQKQKVWETALALSVPRRHDN